MSRWTVYINGDVDRRKAAAWAMKAPTNMRIEFKEVRRSLPQNARMWVMLTKVSEQLAWHGQRLTPDDWKLVFLDALKRELRIVPNLDGNGFVNLGRSSSDLSKQEMSDMMEVIEAFCAERGVDLHDEPSPAERETVPA